MCLTVCKPLLCIQVTTYSQCKTQRISVPCTAQLVGWHPVVNQFMWLWLWCWVPIWIITSNFLGNSIFYIKKSVNAWSISYNALKMNVHLPPPPPPPPSHTHTHNFVVAWLYVAAHTDCYTSIKYYYVQETTQSRRNCAYMLQILAWAWLDS